MASSRNLPPERHFGCRCISCTANDFVGRRYSCWLCPGYHLCGNCFDGGMIPITTSHQYYHPLKVNYTLTEYQLYFEGDGGYIKDNPLMQSYKCALCEVRGLKTFSLYKHIIDFHRSHSDYQPYVDMVISHFQLEASVFDITLSEEEELVLREYRETSDYSVPTSGRMNLLYAQFRGGSFCENGLDLAQLLLQLKMLDLTSPDFTKRCFDILRQSYAIRSLQNGREVRKTADKYVRLIQHEMMTGLSERRFRLSRISSGTAHQVKRNFQLFNVAESLPTAAASSAATREFFLALQQSKDQDAQDVTASPMVQGKSSQASFLAETQPIQDNNTDKKLFLCSQFLTTTSRIRSGNQLLRANFIEAILCSMLADEELSPEPVKLFDLDAIKNLPTELRKKITTVSWKPLARSKISPLQLQYINDMKHFYKALDEYNIKCDNQKIGPLTGPDLKGVEVPINLNNNQLAEMDDNGGNQSETTESTNNPEIPEPARSDSEVLEIPNARMIQSIDVIIDNYFDGLDN